MRALSVISNFELPPVNSFFYNMHRSITSYSSIFRHRIALIIRQFDKTLSFIYSKTVNMQLPFYFVRKRQSHLPIFTNPFHKGVFLKSVLNIVISITRIFLCFSQEDILSIWNRTANDSTTTSKIRDTLRKVLALPVQTIIEYKTHTDSLK